MTAFPLYITFFLKKNQPPNSFELKYLNIYMIVLCYYLYYLKFEKYCPLSPPHNPIRRAVKLLDNMPKVTMEIELNGIRMAATIGDSNPWTAKLKPIIL